MRSGRQPHVISDPKEARVLQGTVRRSFTILHVALGLILAVEGALTLVHALSMHHDAHLIAFGTVKTIAALLFIWPRTMLVGGCVLFCTFLIAAAVHVVRREFPSEHLVYAVAVMLVMIHGPSRRSEYGQAAA